MRHVMKSSKEKGECEEREDDKVNQCKTETDGQQV